jgi:hypothetical protein
MREALYQLSYITIVEGRNVKVSTKKLAETEGFEPSDGSPHRQFSRLLT